MKSLSINKRDEICLKFKREHMNVEVELKEHIWSTYHQNLFSVKKFHSQLIKLLWYRQQPWQRQNFVLRTGSQS